ncbi:hypothetical protein BH18ACI2_BH18ACI2_24790 [soil metagenome]
MLKRVAVIGIIITCALLAFVVGGRAEEEEPGAELREEFHQTYPLAPDGRITLSNINGAVRITGWDRPEVKLDAVKRAGTRERLDEAQIEVNANAGGIDIRTRYPQENLHFSKGSRRNPASVDYTLSVPRGARLESIELINGALDLAGLNGEVKASAINGRVSAQELTGKVKLSTINGPLEATFAELRGESVTLNSVNGPVVLTIPSDASASLKASSVHGAITNNLGLPVRRGRYVGNDLAGQLGSGGTRIKLANVSGSIEVRRATDGRPPSPVTNEVSLSDASGDNRAASEEKIEREVEQQVAREMRAVEAEVRAAQHEIERATRDSVRAQTAEAAREGQRVERELQRQQAQIAREAARAGRAAERVNREQIEREIERAMAQVEREMIRHEYSGDAQRRFIKRETKTFNVSGVPRVRLETFDGAVSVQAWDKPEVLLNIVKRAGDEESLRAVRLRAEQQGADISIIAERDRSQPAINDHTGAVVSLEVYVPRNSNMIVKSGDGRLRLEGVHGEIEMQTGDGSVDVMRSQGRLRVQSGDGRVRIAGHDGAAEVQTGDGGLTLGGRFTQLSARTGDGTIWLELPPDTNANIETEAERATSDGVAIAESGADSEQRVRRWRVGSGGNTFTLRTGDGNIYLRRAGSKNAAREQ